MAIDTAAKRFSIMDADMPTQPGMTPPDGAAGVGDRLAMLWLYSGIDPTVSGQAANTIAAFLSAGIGIGGVIATTGVDGGRGIHRQYRPGERRARGLEWRKQRKIEDLVEEAYRKLSGELVDAVNEPGTIREAVAPFAQSSDAAMPPPAAIDFVALSRDLQRAEALLLAYEEAIERKAMMDDDDEVATVLALI